MVYLPHTISIPSLEGLSKLAVGHPMRLSHANLAATSSNGMGVHLTPTQLEKIKHRCSEGKGMDLKMSKSQLEHHMKGTGWFGNLLRKVHGHAKRAANFLGKHPLTQELLGKVKERVKHQIKTAGHELIDEYLPAGNSELKEEAWADPWPIQEVANINPSLAKRMPPPLPKHPPKAPHKIPAQVHPAHDPQNVLASALAKRRAMIEPEGGGIRRRKRVVGKALG